MRYQLVERRTGLDVEVPAHEKFPRGAVAAIELELMRPIVGQTSVSVIEQALEIEQRSDVRVRLPVVITEQTFVVTGQTRVNVRSQHLPVLGESLGRGELDGAIETLRTAKAPWS